MIFLQFATKQAIIDMPESKSQVQDQSQIEPLTFKHEGGL